VLRRNLGQSAESPRRWWARIAEARTSKGTGGRDRRRYDGKARRNPKGTVLFYTTRATDGMRRIAAVVLQLSANAPRNTTANFATAGNDAGRSAYCSQLTNA
jgi:hypothetical protein